MTLDALFKLCTPPPSVLGLPAVELDTGSAPVTYGALFEIAASFQKQLIELNCHRLLISATKGVAAYGAELAALAQGVTFCPINTEAPAARNALIATDFQPDAVFTDNSDLLPDCLGRGVVPLLDVTASKNAHSLVFRAQPDSVAYVIYTSGTTGRPKGVQVTIRSLDWFLGAILERLELPSQPRWSNHPNLAFDLSILDVFGCLAQRGTLLPLSKPLDRAFPGKWISGNRVDVWHSVPSIVQALMLTQAGEDGLLRTVRVVLLCGEPLQRVWAEYLLKYCHPGVRVFNCYGPTETTVFCLTEGIQSTADLDVDQPTVSIGRPLNGADLHLVDGIEPGTRELFISGHGVGPGYLTVSRGESDGYAYGSQRFGFPCYATGDLVEEAGGRLYFRGRADGQVKIRGHRFELDEISSRLVEVGIVSSAVVLVNDRVHLFIGVGTEGLPVSDSIIMDHLRRWLPEYALPRSVNGLAHLPRNVNDKVDRSALMRLVLERGAE